MSKDARRRRNRARYSALTARLQSCHARGPERDTLLRPDDAASVLRPRRLQRLCSASAHVLAPSILLADCRTCRSPPGSPVLSNAPQVVTSYISSSNSTWTYQGCYSDLAPGRVLPNELWPVNKTVESCVEACDSRGFVFCGASRSVLHSRSALILSLSSGVEYHGGALLRFDTRG